MCGNLHHQRRERRLEVGLPELDPIETIRQEIPPLWLALWMRNRDIRAVTIAIPLIETCGAFLVTATAYYGSLLVCELGVNVATPQSLVDRHTSRQWRAQLWTICLEGK